MVRTQDSRPVETFLTEIDEQIRRERSGRNVDLGLRGEDLRRAEAREARVRALDARLRDQFGPDVGMLDADDTQLIEARRKRLEEMKAGAQSIFDNRESVRRRQRAAIEQQSRLYNIKRPNPGETVCLTQARGHQSEEDIDVVSGTHDTTAEFQSDGNRLDLRLHSTGYVSMGRDDWIHFIWDGPGEAGIATVSAAMSITGSILIFRSWAPGVTLHRVRLDAIVRVSQERDGGTVFFPERVFELIQPQGLVGETTFRNIATEETLPFNPGAPIPLTAGRRVAVSVGLRWDLLLRSADDFWDLDFATGSRDFEFPFIMIKHET